jgi:oligopeptide transport system substrate-binding protein
LRADDEDKAAEYLLRAGDQAREEHALDEAIEHYRDLLPLLERRGERQEMALVLFKLALALHMALRFGEANEAYQRAFAHWTAPEPAPGRAVETLRMAASYVPQVVDPAHAGWWPDIELCMQLFDRLVEAWPERTIVPSLAERWEMSDDGLRYRFQLREGLTWSDGTPLTAHDVEFGIKRVLDPANPGASVALYFVLENAQDYALGRSSDVEAVGVRALDDLTVEFRLVVPAPYFMSVANRPDAAPQPRHAIERHGEAWSAPEHQVVSGPLRVAEHAPDRLVLVRHDGYSRPRRGNVARIECVRAAVDDAFPAFARGELGMARVVYTPHTADHVRSPAGADEPLTWLAYIGFDHAHPQLRDVELRRALALTIDRTALAEAAPANLAAATGGVVPPALHGHSPDIAPRLDHEQARQHLARAGARPEAGLSLTAQDVWGELLEIVVRGWRDELGIDVRLDLWPGHEHPVGSLLDRAPMALFGWLPGYPDPEYMLRLLLHSDARTNAVRFADPRFDELIEAARRERSDRGRLERFHEADRYAVADQVALIPLFYGRSTAFVQPYVHGWWEFAKSSANFGDLVVES